MRRVPRQQLHVDFVRAIRASGYSLVTLSALANFAAHTQLVPFLNRNAVPMSALNVERLKTLAAVIHYDGEIFKGGAR